MASVGEGAALRVLLPEAVIYVLNGYLPAELPALRAYAGLKRDCAVIGANTRLEIWDAQAWESYLEAEEPAFAELSQEVMPGIV